MRVTFYPKGVRHRAWRLNDSDSFLKKNRKKAAEATEKKGSTEALE